MAKHHDPSITLHFKCGGQVTNSRTGERMTKYARKKALAYAAKLECPKCNPSDWEGPSSKIKPSELLVALSSDRGGQLTYEHPQREVEKTATLPPIAQPNGWVLKRAHLPEPLNAMVSRPQRIISDRISVRGPITIVFECGCVYFADWDSSHSAIDRDWAVWEAGRRECPVHDPDGWAEVVQVQPVLARAMRRCAA